MEYKLENKNVFVAYRLPGETHHMLLQPHANTYIPFSALQKDEPAFVFHPFEENAKTPALAIPAHRLLLNAKFSFRSTQEGMPHCVTEQDYIPLLEEFIRHIEKGETNKIICSRIIPKEIGAKDLYPLFVRLKKQYPQAFVYLINIPNVGCWMGATPEILLTKHNQMGETVALAGTRPATDANEKWGEKEVVEQQMVERYMANILIKRKKSFNKTGPFSVKAGRVMHLKTRFRFPLQDDWRGIAMDIHPSPAVCGLPKHKAQQFIVNTEPHDREYYCGFLGPVNMKGNTDLFVNLRCMQVYKDRFALYVGGGITIDSIPEKELDETCWKSRTLSDILAEVYHSETV